MLFFRFQSAKKSAKLFGSGICTEFGILISSRKVLNKSAICLVLEFIQNSVFLFYHESEHALMMTHGVMGDESSDDDNVCLWHCSTGSLSANPLNTPPKRSTVTI